MKGKTTEYFGPPDPCDGVASFSDALEAIVVGLVGSASLGCESEGMGFEKADQGVKDSGQNRDQRHWPWGTK